MFLSGRYLGLSDIPSVFFPLAQWNRESSPQQERFEDYRTTIKPPLRPDNKIIIQGLRC